MDDLLTPVASKRLTTIQPAATKSERIIPKIQDVSRPDIKSLDDAIEVLQGSPSASQLTDVLRFLKANHKNKDSKSAQVTHVLLTQTVPDWWISLHDDLDLLQVREDLLEHFREVSGLNAIISRIRFLSTAENHRPPTSGNGTPGPLIIELIHLLEEVLTPVDVVAKIRSKCMIADSKIRQTALWKEFVLLVASGRIISTISETEAKIKNDISRKSSWLADGAGFSRWIARNVAFATTAANLGQEEILAYSLVVGKALSIGYAESLVDELLRMLPFSKAESLVQLKALMDLLPAHQQRNLLLYILRSLDRHFLRDNIANNRDTKGSMPKVISAVAGFVKAICEGSRMLLDYLSELMIQAQDNVIARSNKIQRAILATLSDDEDCISAILEKTLIRFGDQLYIRHAPMSQQEATAQILLITCAYAHKNQPMLFFTIAKSSTQTHAISNRLKASSERAKWLGMNVAMAMSKLSDKEGSQFLFDDDSLRTEEAESYRALAAIDDKPGDAAYLTILANRDPRHQAITSKSNLTEPRPMAKNTQNRVETRSPSGPTPSSSRIVELDSDSDSDDIVAYAKPDSDAEDEDEDPTLIERNKPRAPVYIRDLMAGLQESENFDRHRLALETAAPLITRKANFGKEVSDHAHELATILMNLNDQFEFDEFSELRQNALLALVVAQPAITAPYLAQSCFEGNFSIQQRASVLAALAFGARELAGLDGEQAPTFPSKQLPAHLRAIYGGTDSPQNQPAAAKLMNVSEGLQKALIEPMALSAADQLSGPNALKVRTFSSRMAVEKQRQTRKINNKLAKDVAANFFYPLLSGFYTRSQPVSFAIGADRQNTQIISPHLLPLYIRTITLILHAAGPANIALPQMTREFWELLLSLRSMALRENATPTLEALLFGFLTLLDMNGEKTERLAGEHARELVETREWARSVLEQYQEASRPSGLVGIKVRESGGTDGGGGMEEGEKVRMLAAGVVMRCHEIVERWQRLMIGDLMDT